ncbi:MAG: glycosyltransferase family 4 protein [Patescibacteria group bacterium]
MKILLLSSTNNPNNGYGSVTDNLCRFLAEKVDIELLLPKNSEKINTSYPVRYILPEYTYTLKSPKIINYFNFEYKNNPDVVHSLVEFPYMLIGARLAHTLHAKYVISTYGTYSVSHFSMWPESYFVRRAYNSARMIIVSSLYTKRLLESFKINVPIKIIHPGVNILANLKKDDLKKKYNGKTILLTVGGVKPRRGQDLVIEALYMLKKKRNDFHYLMVGSIGAWGESLKNRVSELELDENVTFLDQVEEKDRQRYFHLCDIYIQTPRVVDEKFEGFGITYLEASACGKPIIATRSGGNEDAVINGETGIMVEENDVNGVTDAINKLIDTPSLARRLGVNGLKYAKKHDWRIIGKKYLDLYKMLK